jgi:hypothetical protein
MKPASFPSHADHPPTPADVYAMPAPVILNPGKLPGGGPLYSVTDQRREGFVVLPDFLGNSIASITPVPPMPWDCSEFQNTESSNSWCKKSTM